MKYVRDDSWVLFGFLIVFIVLCVAFWIVVIFDIHVDRKPITYEKCKEFHEHQDVVKLPQECFDIIYQAGKENK